MPKKTDGETMHERILHSALEIFSDKGYFAATIKDISNRAGCNTVTIFRHFEDKMGLFLQVVERYHKFEFDAEALNLKLSYKFLKNNNFGKRGWATMGMPNGRYWYRRYWKSDSVHDRNLF